MTGVQTCALPIWHTAAPSVFVGSRVCLVAQFSQSAHPRPGGSSPLSWFQYPPGGRVWVVDWWCVCGVGVGICGGVGNSGVDARSWDGSAVTRAGCEGFRCKGGATTEIYTLGGHEAGAVTCDPGPFCVGSGSASAWGCAIPDWWFNNGRGHV